MITEEQLAQVRDLVSNAQHITILISDDASLDQAASALALGLSLGHLGKEVLLASPEPLPDEYHILLGQDQLRHELGHQNLSISFAYEETAVDKVSYHIDDTNQRFYLVIKPQKGSAPLDAQTVEYAYTGAESDLIFLVGVHSLEMLEHLYYGYEDFYQTTTTVVFHNFEPEIGLVKLNVGDKSSLSEGMCGFIEQIGLLITPEAATNLLAGIEDTTDGFRSLAVTADTFAAVSGLMRQGARRARRGSTQPQTVPNTRDTHTHKVSPSFVEAIAKKSQQARAAGNNVNANGKTIQPNLRPPTPKKTKPADEPQPGDLDFQPSGFGPGGAG